MPAVGRAISSTIVGQMTIRKLLRVSGESKKGLSVLIDDPKWVFPRAEAECPCGERCPHAEFREEQVLDSFLRQSLDLWVADPGAPFLQQGAALAVQAEQAARYQVWELMQQCQRSRGSSGHG